MPIDLCPVCKNIRFSDHVCPPAWSVYLDAEGYAEDDAKTIYTRYPSDAAEQFAGWYFASIGESGDGEYVDVVVTNLEEKEKLYYTVRGKADVIYTATEKRFFSMLEEESQ